MLNFMYQSILKSFNFKITKLLFDFEFAVKY